LAFGDSSTGVAAGREGTLVRTDNGGITWNIVESNSESFLRDIVHIGNNTWFAVGSGGTILSSENDGRVWHSVKSGTNKNLS
jgi:photosystem II stability/assembly factor-like uncharacterized protein